MKNLAFIIFIIPLLLIIACDKDDNPVVSIPNPEIIDNMAIANSESVYYAIWPPYVTDKTTADPQEDILQSIVDLGIKIKKAYFPESDPTCLAMGAVSVAIVEIAEPDSRMLDLNFQADPEDWWLINCGVAKLWYYSFD
ncbi:MAG: hypothetical protein ABIJ45_14295 [Candidatus Zixiibacteriota bacterium]